MKLCECGCGKEIKEDKRFVRGHYRRGKPSPLKGRKQSKEHIQKRVESRKGYKHFLETRKKQSESNKGKSRNKGKKRSLKTRKRISETLTGRKLSKKTRKRISETLKGRKRSLESRRKQSEILTGRKRSLESRKKQSESRKGMVFTEEHRKNMSISANNRIDPRYISGYFYSNKMQKEILYQSSLELRALELFEKDEDIWSIERYNLGSIKYRINRSYHSYNPDYFLNERIVIEVKPEWQLKDKKNLAKIKAGKKYCKERNLEFEVLTEKNLYKKHKNRKKLNIMKQI